MFDRGMKNLSLSTNYIFFFSYTTTHDVFIFGGLIMIITMATSTIIEGGKRNYTIFINGLLPPLPMFNENT